MNRSAPGIILPYLALVLCYRNHPFHSSTETGWEGLQPLVSLNSDVFKTEDHLEHIIPAQDLKWLTCFNFSVLSCCRPL